MKALEGIGLESKGRRGERGSAMVFAVVGVGAMLVLSLGFMQISLRADEGQKEVIDQVQALYVAEAGLAEAVASMRVNWSGNLGSESSPVRMGDGLFWSAVTETDVDEYRIDVTAMFGSGRIALSSVARRGSTGGVMQGLYTTRRLELKKEFFIDSYDGEAGDYASQATNTDANGKAYAKANGRVRSGEAVKIDEKASIFGDVVYGKGHDVKWKNQGNSSHSGDVLEGDYEELPAVEIPDVGPSAGKVHLHGVKDDSTPDLVLGPGDIHYEEFKIHKDSNVKIIGPTRLVVDRKFEVDCELIIDDTAGPVHVYVRDEVKIKKKAAISTTSGSTGNFMVMVGTKLDSKGKRKQQKVKIEGTFTGVLYAPGAHVEFKKEAEVFGAILAYSVKHSEKAKIHYDESLGRKDMIAGGALSVTVSSWRSVAFDNGLFGGDRRDPFVVLGIHDREELKEASVLWESEGTLSRTNSAGRVTPWETTDSFPWLDPKSVTAMDVVVEDPLTTDVVVTDPTTDTTTNLDTTVVK